MRILAALRAEYPDMVMDHRQTAHIWGPWYQLAGSYLEPIAGDENPETLVVPPLALFILYSLVLVKLIGL
jgi:hypothetical protein